MKVQRVLARILVITLKGLYCLKVILDSSLDFVEIGGASRSRVKISTEFLIGRSERWNRSFQRFG